MNFLYKLILLGSIFFFTACSTTMTPRGWKHKEVKYVCTTKPIQKPIIKQIQKPHKKSSSVKISLPKKVLVCKKITSSKNYKYFKAHTNLRKSFKVFKDTALLSQATSRNTKLKVDISEQRVRLYVNNKVALDSPCTTGAKHKFEPNTKIYRDKHTPKGTFRILEKIRDKRSNIFGNYYRGKKRVYHGDRTKFKGSKKGLRYEGASLKNWMRLTGGGIGLHASKYVKRHPGTNGCIRLPYNVSKVIFKHLRKGTKVSVVN